MGGFIKRGSEELINTSSLRVVLVKTNINGKRYYILTSFPKT
ncbi:RNase A-like domain-containing protein [Oligella urethralis]